MQSEYLYIVVYLLGSDRYATRICILAGISACILAGTYICIIAGIYRLDRYLM